MIESEPQIFRQLLEIPSELLTSFLSAQQSRPLKENPGIKLPGVCRVSIVVVEWFVVTLENGLSGKLWRNGGIGQAVPSLMTK
ncbi:MAG TPA: hypothetical protein DCM07_20095 [Planctomycetaceae bacterium]|nr:hypothetical protein [Gimesia sp.]HAH47110.1 hypothetical protein [Planctomycetaceae bacterium]HBL46831.1 hypothetical protein [Planctomycetaceae bacterium]